MFATALAATPYALLAEDTETAEADARANLTVDLVIDATTEEATVKAFVVDKFNRANGLVTCVRDLAAVFNAILTVLTLTLTNLPVANVFEASGLDAARALRK